MSDKENTRSDCAVRIAVRERPFSADEISANVASGIEKYANDGNIIIVEDRPFGFDHVFGPSATQEEVFEAIARPLVDKMLSGFNCSLLAYGQSGNGKTYTMGLDGQQSDEVVEGVPSKDSGIIIRTLRSIFEAVQGDDAIRDLKLEVSFIEIYNERVYDLLSPTYTEAEKFKKLFTKREMRTERDAQEILTEAYQKRHVRPTKINLASSRSHAVFTIYATLKRSDFCSIHSELNLVDLAGAEGVRKTGHHGQALTEGVNINQGLLSVGRILQAIAKGEKVIPYRESVLTRVLQDSLNRNCFLTLLACVSPSRLDTKETLSTLRFAENVGTLKNNPKINVIMNEITMARRKTPTKQMFTPRPLGTGGRKTLANVNETTVQKKRLNFPETSTAKKTKVAGGFRQPLAVVEGHAAGVTGRRATELDFSLAVANGIANSTFINPQVAAIGEQQNQTLLLGGSYSPVIRRCISEIGSTLDEKINAAVSELANKINASVVVGGGTGGGGKRSLMGETERESKRMRRSTRGSTVGGLFKVPQPVGGEEGNLLNETFDFGRNSLANDGEATLMHEESAVGETTMLRRSRRVQELNESRVLRERRRREEEEEKKEGKIAKEKARKSKKAPPFLKNKYLASYFRLSTHMEGGEEEEEQEAEKKSVKGKKSGANQHSVEVLKILNQGNLKELQILPQIGLKTAYQIMSCRTTKGRFKSFKDLKRLNWTEKKVEAFMKANFLL